MNLQKTIRAKITHLTRTKEQLLEQEYTNYQTLLQSLLTNNPNCLETYPSISLYSATKQQALRFTKKARPKPGKQYPLLIRRDVFRMEQKQTTITRFWAKIPISGVYGGVWVPIHLANKHIQLLTLSIRQVKLIKKKSTWFLHITIQTQAEITIPKDPVILSIDLGEKFLAASVELFNNSVTNHRLYGKKARGIRRHHAWLRKRLGNRKKLRTIKRLADKEKRQINDLLHKVSSQIVNQAKKANTVIVLGKLKGIRNRAKGKRFNRIVSNMPYYKLTQYIIYKAAWAGIAVFQVTEHNTSRTCHRCGSQGKRPSQGLFTCPSCGLQYNADLNAAINLAERFSGQRLENGVVLNSPLSRTKSLQDPHGFSRG